MKTKEQQAQEYAEKKLKENLYTDLSDYVFYRTEIKQAYLDGYTACEQSRWRSVEDELPEENLTALCRLDDGEYIVARFDHMEVYDDGQGRVYAVPEWWVEQGCESYTLGNEITHWMPIPPIPDTNSTKQ